MTDVDECSSDPCGDNSVCSNTVGSFTCVCNSGFGNVMMNFNKCVAIGGEYKWFTDGPCMCWGLKYIHTCGSHR